MSVHILVINISRILDSLHMTYTIRENLKQGKHTSRVFTSFKLPNHDVPLHGVAIIEIAHVIYSAFMIYSESGVPHLAWCPVACC
jgi:hypothetical protein